MVTILCPIFLGNGCHRKQLNKGPVESTDEVRKQGLAHLEVIKKMILKSGDDRRAAMGDMTY
jgi:hypothetical protein